MPAPSGIVDVIAFLQVAVGIALLPCRCRKQLSLASTKVRPSGARRSSHVVRRDPYWLSRHAIAGVVNAVRRVSASLRDRLPRPAVSHPHRRDQPPATWPSRVHPQRQAGFVEVGGVPEGSG